MDTGMNIDELLKMGYPPGEGIGQEVGIPEMGDSDGMVVMELTQEEAMFIEDMRKNKGV